MKTAHRPTIADLRALKGRRQLSMLRVEMGAGAGCDAQYLFASDVLGSNRGHVPRHAKVYRDFAAEHERMQAERVAAFREYQQDVAGGAYPQAGHMVGVSPEVLGEFRQFLDQAH